MQPFLPILLIFNIMYIIRKYPYVKVFCAARCAIEHVIGADHKDQKQYDAIQ